MRTATQARDSELKGLGAIHRSDNRKPIEAIMAFMSGVDRKRAGTGRAVGMALLTLAACSSSPAPNAIQTLQGAANGTLAQSSDGALLYAVSADDNTVVVVDPNANQGRGGVVASVSVGLAPARVVVGSDDTLYVSNRKSRSISVIHRPHTGRPWTEATRIAAGAEPIGLAVSQDGRSLYVANHGSGTVQAFDLTTTAFAPKWEVAVSEFPRALAALADGRIYVTHYRSGLVDVLSAEGDILKAGIDTSAVGAVPALTVSTSFDGTSTHQPTFRSVGLDSLVVSHDGARVYAVHRRERQDLISDRNFVPIVAPAITTFETATDTAHDDVTEASNDYPPTIIFPDNQANVVTQGSGTSGGFGGGPVPCSPPAELLDGGAFFDGDSGEFLGGCGGSGGGSSYGGEVPPSGALWTQGPAAAIEDAQGEFLYIANENSGDITVLPTHSRNTTPVGGISATIHENVGNGPSGLAMSPDQKTLYVFSAIDHTIGVIQSQGAQLAVVQTIAGVGTFGTLSPDVQAGRGFFYSASDPTMSAPGSGVACESCHLEGGNDGNVWQFVFGERKTMSLLGKSIQNTAPYHWDGTENDVHALLRDTILVRMGGQGTDTSQDAQITSFLAQLQPYDNPNQLVAGLTAGQTHGQRIFAQNCASCHAGAIMTDNGFHDVGTRVLNNPNGQPDDLCRLGIPNADGSPCVSDGQLPSVPNPNNNGGFNTPTTLGLFFGGPYFHDGSAATIDQAVTRMVAGAKLAPLSSNDQADLVSYLQTL